MGDRRDSPRLALALAAQYRVEGSVLGRRATLSDLSPIGVAFVTEEPLEPGTRLHYLRFTLGEAPATHTLRPAAVVVRCTRQEAIGRANEFLIGAELVDLGSTEREILERFVAEELARAGLPDSSRIELQEPVAVRFDRFDEFVTEVSKNLSLTGMFIQTERPRPTGAKFDFVLQLGNDFKLVQGRAQVVWTRGKAEGEDLPPGMGIRFLGLDKTSENVLRRLIGEHTQAEMPRALGTAPPVPVATGDAQVADSTDDARPAPGNGSHS